VPARVRVIIQYIFLLALTGFLVWFSLRGLTGDSGENSWDILLGAWHTADKTWLIVMAAVAFLSHLIRAKRWEMLIEPTGHRITVSNSFLSLMVGYLVNLVIPRGGEVSRCYNLYKLEKTPVDISFGTVVTERLIDLLCLILLVAISFFYESKKLLQFVDSLPFNLEGPGKYSTLIVWAIVILVAFCAATFLLLRFNVRLRTFVVKTLHGFRQGLLTVFRLKNPAMFVVYSIVIWLLYFAMSYAVIQAFPATKVLGFGAVLSLFAIGAIAMAAPLPAGTGSYHVLVPQGLIFLYAIPENEAVAFTFIFHGWQTVIMIVGGALSLVITNLLIKRNKI
jgi:glycosyltransferase 2 family protein